MATLRWASSVAAPRWGVQITLGWFTSSLFLVGSSSKTSRAAPATLPELSASRRSFSLTIPPRAQLTMKTPLRIFAMADAFRRFFVSFVSGVCTEMKCDRFSSSSRLTSVMPIFSAVSGARKGSKAMTFIFRPWARSATMVPTRPMPMMPRVLL